MLLFFEGVMCRQRQNSLTMLRNMRRPPTSIFVFRDKKWVSIQSDEIMPGDVLSLAHHSGRGGDEDKLVPCDAFLLRGSCVVNEVKII